MLRPFCSHTDCMMLVFLTNIPRASPEQHRCPLTFYRRSFFDGGSVQMSPRCLIIISIKNRKCLLKPPKLCEPPSFSLLRRILKIRGGKEDCLRCDVSRIIRDCLFILAWCHRDTVKAECEWVSQFDKSWPVKDDYVLLVVLIISNQPVKPLDFLESNGRGADWKSLGKQRTAGLFLKCCIYVPGTVLSSESVHGLLGDPWMSCIPTSYTVLGGA